MDSNLAKKLKQTFISFRIATVAWVGVKSRNLIMAGEWPVATCIQCVIVSSLINPLVYHGHHHNPPEFSLVYHSHEG